jgi:phospholipid transport system substrate-binding protein
MKWIVSSLMLLMSVNLWAGQEWDNAAAEMDLSIKQMLEKVIPYKGEASADLEPLVKELDEITKDSVDYPYIAKFVMGKFYRRATDKQKKDFERVFKRTLLKTYAKGLVTFNVKSYRVVKPRADSPYANKQKVKIEVMSTNGKTYQIINFVVLKDGIWKLVNLDLDGLNVRSNFKNQFASIAQRNRGKLDKAILEWKNVMAKKY